MTDTPKPPPKRRAPRKRTPKKAASTTATPAAEPGDVAAAAPAEATVSAPPPAAVDAPATDVDGATRAASPEPVRHALIRTVLDVRWGDMDAFSHVNNSVFLTYLEEARLRWLQGLPGPWIEEHAAPLLAAANVQFRRPIEWPGSVAVELFVERVGTSSLTIGHRIVDADDAAKLFCDGNAVMVWIDQRTGKGSALPAAVRASV